jgi:hypothetical protein
MEPAFCARIRSRGAITAGFALTRCPGMTRRTRKRSGIDAHFADNKLVLHRPQSGAYQEPLTVVVGEQGKIVHEMTRRYDNHPRENKNHSIPYVC